MILSTISKPVRKILSICGNLFGKRDIFLKNDVAVIGDTFGKNPPHPVSVFATCNSEDFKNDTDVKLVLPSEKFLLFCQLTSAPGLKSSIAHKNLANNKEVVKWLPATTIEESDIPMAVVATPFAMSKNDFKKTMCHSHAVKSISHEIKADSYMKNLLEKNDTIDIQVYNNGKFSSMFLKTLKITAFKNFNEKLVEMSISLDKFYNKDLNSWIANPVEVIDNHTGAKIVGFPLYDYKTKNAYLVTTYYNSMLKKYEFIYTSFYYDKNLNYIVGDFSYLKPTHKSLFTYGPKYDLSEKIRLLNDENSLHVDLTFDDVVN